MISNVSIYSNFPFKSITKLEWNNVPSFSVVTGLNGAGKSHLLEMIAVSCGFSIKGAGSLNGEKPAKINGMNVGSGDVLYVEASKNFVFNDCAGMKDLEERIQQLYKRPFNDVNSSWRSAVKLYAGFNVPNTSEYSESQVTGPSLSEFRARLTPSIITNERLTGHTPDLALLFFSYSVMSVDAKIRGLSESQIFEIYGPPPWDVLNNIFSTSGLNFRVEQPPPPCPSVFTPDHGLSLKFYDTVKKIRVSPNQLSSGEKVLVAMIFLYYTLDFGRSKYKLLLLDEPDTHLHPHFVSKFIKILNDVFVEERNVTVIMTSHSPITVALIPESAIFIQDGFSGNAPRKVSRSHALEALLAGVPSLSVQYESRRQIFVESKYDIKYFQRLHSLLCRSHQFEYQPVFLESHSGTSNCSDVISIVEKLRSSGSDLAFGIIDFDGSNRSTESVFVLGEGSRYSIENYILDPIYVTLALIRHRKKNSATSESRGRVYILMRFHLCNRNAK